MFALWFPYSSLEDASLATPERWEQRSRREQWVSDSHRK